MRFLVRIQEWITFQFQFEVTDITQKPNQTLQNETNQKTLELWIDLVTHKFIEVCLLTLLFGSIFQS